MGELELQVLGPLRIETAEGAVALPGAKQRLLAALLAAGGRRPVSADALVDALWPDQRPVDPDHALHNLVSRLRRGFGSGPPAVLRSSDGYQLATDVTVDAERFRALVERAAAARAEGRLADALTSLAAAEELWRGPPFADVPDRPVLTAETARLNDLRRRADDLRFDAELAAGRHVEVIDDLGREVSEHPLDERRRGQLMVALARSGRQAEALAVYQDAVELLREELGVDPGPGLRGIHVEILRQSPELLGRTDRGAGMAPPGPTERAGTELPAPLIVSSRQPLVGRDGEIRRLTELWRDAAVGDGRLVLLEGEPGVGKTRLLAALACELVGQDADLLFGRCDDGLRTPYQPFAEALGGAGLPEPASPTPADEGDGSRHAFFDAVLRRLERSSAAAPTALLIDDLHWASLPTLLLLRHIVRWGASLRLLVVATVRDRGDAADAPVRSALAQLRADPSVHRLPVAGLDVAAVRQLAVDHDLADEVHARTRGNAFLVTELLRDRQRGAPGASTSISEAIPGRVGALVEARRYRLSPAADRLLDTAAVIGERFDASVAGRAAGSDDQALADALDGLVTAGFLELHDRGARRYGFVHALVRDTVLDRLNPVRRCTLHRAAAQAIEAATTGRVDEVAAELAHHFLRGEDWEPALRYSMEAGDVAHRRYAWEDAASHYRSALAVCDRTGDHARRPAVLLALADAERRSANSATALEIHRAAFVASRDHGTPEQLAESAIGFEDTRAEETFERNAGPSRGMLEQALEAIRDTDTRLETALLARLAIAESHHHGITAHARDLAARALDGARATHDPGDLATALEASVWVNWSSAGLERRLALTDELRRVASRLDDRRILRTRVLRAAARLEAGDRVTFESELAGYRAEAERVSEPWYSWWTRALDGSRALIDGRLGDVSEVVGELSRHADGRQQQELVGLFATVVTLEQAGPDRLGATIDGWRATLRGGHAQPGGAHAGLALLTALAGDVAAARRHLDAVVPSEEASRSQGTWHVAFLGLAAADIGHLDTAASVRGLLAPYRRRVILMGAFCPFLSTSFVLARVADALGDSGAALDFAREATEFHDGLGAAAWGARSRHHHAELLFRYGTADDRDSAVELATAALRTAGELGLTRLGAAADELLQRLAVSSADGSPRR